MDVILAKSAGFCFGVKRAVDLAYSQADKNNVYTFGPIIHNEEVVGDLEKHGINVINTIDDIKKLDGGTVIIRSHGVTKEVYDALEMQGIEIVDATCPFVLKIHKIVREKSALGRSIVIIGNAHHPEVEAIKGWSSTPVYIIDTEEKALEFTPNKDEKISLVSQTTFNFKKFQELVEIISKKVYDIDISNTICNATEERQTEARELAKRVDSMIVIGGKSSSNTRKLYEICKEECENTVCIQTFKDLDLNKFNSSVCVGITAGASTPNNIIEEVQKHVR